MFKNEKFRYFLRGLVCVFVSVCLCSIIASVVYSILYTPEHVIAYHENCGGEIEYSFDWIDWADGFAMMVYGIYLAFPIYTFIVFPLLFVLWKNKAPRLVMHLLIAALVSLMPYAVTLPYFLFAKGISWSLIAPFALPTALTAAFLLHYWQNVWLPKRQA